LNAGGCRAPQQQRGALAQQIIEIHTEILEKSALWARGASAPCLRNPAEEPALRGAAAGGSSPEEEEEQEEEEML